jgi:hypothetical protein
MSMWRAAGRRTRRGRWRDGDAVAPLEGGDGGRVEPDRHLDGKGCAVVCKHEALQAGVPLVVAADRGDDERGRLGGCIVPFHDDEIGPVGEGRGEA